MARLKRDDNFVPVSGGVSSSDSSVVLPLKIDPTTGRLLVSSVGSATEYTEGDTDTTFTGIISLGEYNDIAKPLQLDSNGYLKVNVVAGSASGEQYADGTVVDASHKGNLILGTDGSNYQILSVDSSGNLNVNVVSGSAASEQYADGTAVDASYKGNLILGTDGSHYQILAVDGDGHLQVDVLSAPTIDIGDISKGTQTNDVKITLDGEAVILGSPTDGTYIGDIKFGESLPAGTNNIGKVDINSEPTPSTIYNGKKTVTTAGTAEALASSTAVKSVVIKALYSNTGKVYVGNSSVSSANGIELEAGDAIGIDIDDLSKIYIDVDNNGEGVSYIATN